MRNRIKVLLILFFFANAVYSQKNIKFWYEGRLEESDFVGEISKSDRAQAWISSSILLKRDSINSKYYFVAYMDKLNSSMKNYAFQKKYYPNRDSETVSKLINEALKHEQMHFDITEIFARRANKILSKTKGNPQKILNKKHKQLNKFQAKFDEETGHGIVEFKNEYYIYILEEELEKLDEFKYKERKQ